MLDEKSRRAERMKPEICPAWSLSGLLHSSEWGLPPTLTHFCPRRESNGGGRVSIHCFMLWLKWILLALNVGATFSEQLNSPLPHWWCCRQCSILALEQPHSAEEAVNRTNVWSCCGCLKPFSVLAPCPVQAHGARVSPCQCTVSGVFSALSLPYLFSFVLAAAIRSHLNSQQELHEHSFHRQVLTPEHGLSPPGFNPNPIT